MANLLNMQQILGGIQQQYPVTPPTPMPTPTPTVSPKSDKNEMLAMMLYALGGALKGDKNFVQNTLQLQQMQEGKKKEKEQKEAWEKVKQSALIQSNPNLATIANALTPEQGVSLAVEMETREPKEKKVYEAADGRKYYADTGELVFPGVEVPKKPIDPSKAIQQEELNVLRQLKSVKGDIEQLNPYEKLIYENFIKRDNAQSILEQLGIVGNTGLIIEKVEG